MAVKGKVAKGLIDLVRSPFERTIGPDFDPRFDPRKKEQERLQELTLGVEPRSMEVPEISLQDLEGRPFITSMSDLTAAGGVLTDVRGRPLEVPVNLRGGQDFMFDETLNPGQVWASARGPSGGIMAAAKSIQRKTKEEPLFIPWRMAPSSSDFATMTGETMLSYAASNMSKAEKKALDKAIREYVSVGKMVKGKRVGAGLQIKGWKGVDDPSFAEVWRKTPDSLRKELMDKVMDKKFRGRGGLSIGEARLAVSDASQLAAREGGIQNVGRVFADGDRTIERSTHPSYPYAVPGEGIGRIKEDVNIFQLLPEIVEERKIADPLNQSRRDFRSMQMGAKTGTITPEILRNIFGGGAAAGVGTGLMAPEEAEAAGFGTLAKAIGQGTRRVFTGSPAEYTQPSLQKIGTGEGNQAFGYGLYFSESPGVATGYRKILSGEKLIKRLEDQELDPDLYAEDVSEMLDEGVFGEAETRFLRALEEADYLGFDHPYQAVRATFSPRMGFDMGDEAVVNLLKMRDEMGFLYETEIPAETFLDWDLPLADQPEIVQRVVDEVARRQPERFDATMMRRYQEGKMKGKEAYYLFSQNPQEASQVWANYGVPGVRYSSQGRRSAAQKEMIPQNYVVFDDKLINMVSRNDMPLEGNFDESAARQAMDPEMLRSRLRQMGPVGTVAASAGAVASPLDRQDDVPAYMRRLDGTVKSERGFLGPIRNNVSGKTMTEVSIGQPGSEEGFYPLLVPTLTPEEVETIANMDLERERPPFSIIEKARAHAMERIDRGLSPFYEDGEEGGEARSPLERPEAAERRVNARALAVASNTLERLRRERGPRMAPLRSNAATAFGDYLTENRPSEMDPVQRALQNLEAFQGLGEYIRTTGEGQRTTLMQDINAALDVVPL